MFSKIDLSKRAFSNEFPQRVVADVLEIFRGELAVYCGQRMVRARYRMEGHLLE